MIFRNTVFRNKIKIWFLHSTLVVIVAWILFMPSFVKYQKGGNNIFRVVLNGVEVGTVESRDDAYEALRMARKSISNSTDELTLANANLDVEGQNVLWGTVQSPSVVASNMETVLNDSKKSTLNRAYSIKINEFSVNLASIDEVMKLLETALLDRR